MIELETFEVKTEGCGFLNNPSSSGIYRIRRYCSDIGDNALYEKLIFREFCYMSILCIVNEISLKARYNVSLVTHRGISRGSHGP